MIATSGRAARCRCWIWLGVWTMMCLCRVACATATPTTDYESSSEAAVVPTTTEAWNETVGRVDGGTSASTNTSKYPYRICSMPQGTDMVRFARNIECAKYNPKLQSEEGIMLVYKMDIVPYTFPVYVYSKELYFQKSYSYITSSYLLSSSTETVAMPMWEVNFVNLRNQCYASYSRVMTGTVYVVYDKDDYKNRTVWLFRDDYYSKTSQRYISRRDRYHMYGSTWLYKETCSITCIVLNTTARSKHPYDSFVLSSGNTVDISPFYDGTNGKAFNEDRTKFSIFTDYHMLRTFGTVNSPFVTVKMMAFLELSDLVVGWEVKREQNVTCRYRLWENVPRAIRTEHEESYHFVSRGLTATFVTDKSPLFANGSAWTDQYACIKAGVDSEINDVFEKEYNETHERNGGVHLYRTTGGLLIAWQGLKQKSIASLERIYNESLNDRPASEASGNVTRRRKRSVEDDAPRDITYAQLQFTFDTLRNYINQVLGNIAEAWCLDQKRTAEVLRELSKINPSNILSAVYDRPVAARLAGDVIALADCVSVNQSSVKILKDMRKMNDAGVIEVCYSRPLVRFSFDNSEEVQSGQLGEDNEILLGTHRTENCHTPNVKIFVAGNVGYEYRNYIFRSVVNLSGITEVDTMISLSVDPLENTDFKVLQLYSEGEMRSANVFDLEEIMLEYNAYKRTVRYLETKVQDSVPPYLRGLDDFMSGLGAAGKGAGMVLGAVGGAVSSLASGIVNFFTNPFGTVTVTLFLVAVIAIVIVLYQKGKSSVQKPVDYFFPWVAHQTTSSVSTVTETIHDGPDERTLGQAPPPPPYTEGDYLDRQKSVKTGSDEARAPPDHAAVPTSGSGRGAGTAYSKEDALQMLMAIRELDASEKSKVRDEKVAARDDADPKPSLLDRIRYRGYRKLSNGWSDFEKDTRGRADP
uniref:Glycoprotein B n=1 Tax=Bat betaherpesvirus 2 TaxID=668548 RepID=C7G4B9_9BETA|nr:glycoprotein B [Bat betaherpesvirus 2]